MFKNKKKRIKKNQFKLLGGARGIPHPPPHPKLWGGAKTPQPPLKRGPWAAGHFVAVHFDAAFILSPKFRR